MNRRSFLQSILVACAAPAIVRVDSLMRIIPRDAVLIEVVEPFSISKGNLAGAMWPGINAFWKMHYYEVKTEFEKLYEMPS